MTGLHTFGSHGNIFSYIQIILREILPRVKFFVQLILRSISDDLITSKKGQCLLPVDYGEHSLRPFLSMRSVQTITVIGLIFLHNYTKKERRFLSKWLNSGIVQGRL